MTDTLDHKASKLAVASLLYYGADQSYMTDADYDKMALEIAENWNQLSDFRKWQLISPENIKASGFRIKATLLTLSIANAILSPKDEILLTDHSFNYDEDQQVHWLHVGSFHLSKLK